MTKKCKHRDHKVFLIVNANVSDRILKNQLAAHREHAWIYFGKDPMNYARIQKFHGQWDPEMKVGGVINQVARILRRRFVNFDEYLTIGNRTLWSATTLAEKNPYTSDFFYFCCALNAIPYLLEKRKPFLIFCEDLGLSLALHAELNRQRKCTKIRWYWNPFVWPSVTMGRALNAVNLLARMIAHRVVFVLSWMHKRDVLKKYLQGHSSKNPQVFFTLWTDQETFASTHQIDDDTYFGLWPSDLRAQGKTIGYIASPVEWISDFEDIVRSTKDLQEPVIFPVQTFGWKDVLWIIFATLSSKVKVAEHFPMGEVDVRTLFLNELRKEKTRGIQMDRLPYYFVGRYLASREGAPEQVIHLYENQPWEKMLRLGFKKYLPKTQVVGYQHTPFPPLYLNYFPSRNEIVNGELPDHVVTIGPEHRKIFKAHDYPEKHLQEGEARRFRYLFERNDSRSKSLEQIRSSKIILVAASISPLESFELVSKTIEAFRNSPEYQIWIKLHPKMPQWNTEDFVLPAHMRFVDAPIEALLRHVSVVFYNFTAVAYEALACQIPVVFVQSDIWFDMNKLEWFLDASFQARTAEQMHSVLAQIENWSESDWQNWTDRTRSVIVQSFYGTKREDILKNCVTVT